MANIDQLHITVGAMPNGEVSIRHELNLLRAALLYGDRVRFCSPGSVILTSIAMLDTVDVLDIVREYAKITSNSQIAEGVSLYTKLRQKKYRGHKENTLLATIERQLRQAASSAKQYFEQLTESSGLKELAQIYDSGLIDIDRFDVSNTKELVEHYYHVVSKAVVAGNTYPLFDDGTGNLISAAINEGKLTVLGIPLSRAKQSSLSANLFSRLPLFDSLPFDELLDVRRELNAHLVRFRACIIKFSHEIENAPWVDSFPLEAEEIYREYIAPAIIEIDDAIKSNHAIFSLVPSVATSVIGVAVGQLLDLPVILAGCLGLGVGSAITTTLKEIRQNKQKIEAHQLYFYYSLKGKLTPNS